MPVSAAKVAIRRAMSFGGPPTNRMVEFDGLVMALVRDGRIVEAWNCFDFPSMYQQIGWVDKPPTP
jgi:hypothetical protein